MQKTRIIGTQGSGARVLEQHVHPFKTARGNHVGAVVLNERFLNFRPEFHPFLNDTFGTAMNQNIAFGSVAVTIHDGGTSSSADTGTADTNTPNHVIQSGKTFSNTTVIGSSVNNTSGGLFANVTIVADTDLTCDDDVCPNGNEAYIIDAVWDGTAIAGTWDFSTSGVITLTAGNDGDEANFNTSNALQLYNWANFTAFTGAVNLNTYSGNLNDIFMSFDLNGTLVGNTVRLNNFIDTGDFGAQQFIVPKVALGLTTQNVNGLTLLVERTGGAKPDMTFDNLQLEASGTPAVFKATTPLGTRFHITEIRIRFEDAISAVLTDGSMPNIDPNAILGVSALTNGILFASVQGGKNIFSVTLKDLGDFLATGSNLINVSGNATNTGLTLVIEFPEPIVLEGGESENFLSFTISDNLSALTRFTAAARGALEV